MLSEFDISRTELPFHCVEQPIGVVFNVTGIPTECGVGGVGQTAVEMNFAKLLRQQKSFDIGISTRVVLAKKMGRNEPLTDAELPIILKQLGNEKDYTVDYAMDSGVVDFVLKMMQRRKTRRTAVVIATKLFPLLVDKYLMKLARVVPIMVGVTTTDAVANLRKLKAAEIKAARDGGNVPNLQDIAVARSQRLARDQQKYSAAYPGLIYTANAMCQSVHYLLDNSMGRSGLQTQAQILEIMSDVVKNNECIAPFILKYLPNELK